MQQIISKINAYLQFVLLLQSCFVGHPVEYSQNQKTPALIRRLKINISGKSKRTLKAHHILELAELGLLCQYRLINHDCKVIL